VLEKRDGPRLRTYTGEEECRPLVRWLNREGKTRAGFKIQALLTYARILSQALPKAAGDRDLRDLEEAVAEQVSYWESLPNAQTADRAKRLRRILKTVGVPKVKVSVKVKFEDAGPSQRLLLVPAADTPKGEALLSALRLSEKGILDRVRKCPRCGKWFFARFRHQRFHHLKCQQKHFRDSDAWKEHRREWMRDYYKKQQMCNVK
jgi:ribosomal protein S27AE/uncharacterized protein YodC (DUF2158 family)